MTQTARIILRAVAFAALTGFVAGVPTAASAAGQIYACVNNSSGTIHVVGASASCASNEILLVWNTTGPQGPAGKDGANGTNGINGTNGSNGINGTSVTFVGYFTGNANGCPNGGAIYAAGNPPVNGYICNGTNGIDGKDGTNGARADGPCFDNVNRYVDCGNGTVTDTVTGLIWLKQWNCLPMTTWAGANQTAAGLKNGDCGLTDNSSPGDWRLPTLDEWSRTTARAAALNCPMLRPTSTLTNDAGTACYGFGDASSFPGLHDQQFWLSTADETSPNKAWLAFVEVGAFAYLKTDPLRQGWPVRGGPR